MDTVKNFLGYFFNIAPGKEFKYYLALGILITLLLLSGIAFNIIYRKKKKEDFAFKRLFKKTGSHLILFGIIFLLLMGLRYENIPYFSMRIWLYLCLFLLFYFIFNRIKVYKIDYQKEKQSVIHTVTPEHETFKKYTAAKKKK